MAPSFASGLPRLLMCFPCRLRTSTRVQPRLNPQMWRVLSMYCHVLPRVLTWCEVFIQPTTKRNTFLAFQKDFDKRRVKSMWEVFWLIPGHTQNNIHTFFQKRKKLSETCKHNVNGHDKLLLLHTATFKQEKKPPLIWFIFATLQKKPESEVGIHSGYKWYYNCQRCVTWVDSVFLYTTHVEGELSWILTDLIFQHPTLISCMDEHFLKTKPSINSVAFKIIITTLLQL